MKILYFDIDGSILRDSRPKPALADGVFGREVRKAGFQHLVCVSNVITTVHCLEKLGKAPDGLGIVFDVCRGTIQDEGWFRKMTTLVSDPEHRALCIDFAADWWYLDDMAKWFMEQEHLREVYEKNLGERIFAPSETGNGNDVLNWLQICIC